MCENQKESGYPEMELEKMQQLRLAIRMSGMEISLPALDLMLRTIHKFESLGERFSVRHATAITCRIKEIYPNANHASWSLIIDQL